MFRIVLTSLIVFALSLNVAAQTGSMQIGGQARSYYVHAPSGLTNSPLVISMHGMGGTGSQQRSMSGFDRIATREGFIVVYPDGINNRWDITGSTDVNFLLALIDTLSARHGINRNKVYSTGFSMGGMMSYRLACAAANSIAAIGPVGGYILGGERNCTPSRPMPILHIHGTQDSVVIYSGLAAYLNNWKTRNGCPSSAQTTKPYPSSNANSKAYKEYYGPCNQGSEMVVLIVEGMGHAYPGGFGSSDINSSEEIWSFFKNHSLGTTGIISKPEYNSFQRHTQIVNVRIKAGKILVQSEQVITDVELFNVHGRRICSHNSLAGSNFSVSMSLNGVASGIYLLHVKGLAFKETMVLSLP